MANVVAIVVILGAVIFFLVALMVGLRIWEKKHMAKRQATLTVANTFKIKSDKKKRRMSTLEYRDYTPKRPKHPQQLAPAAASAIDEAFPSDNGAMEGYSKDDIDTIVTVESPDNIDTIVEAESQDNLHTIVRVEGSHDQADVQKQEILESLHRSIIYAIDVV